MSISLQIVPLSDSVEMLRAPDRNSAYALSGHVSISIHPTATSFFDASRRTTRFLLQSLELTFEGQSELFTPQSGYCPMRLCSITRQLAPSNTHVELSNEGHEDTNEPSTWNIVFNIPVPGWLPATSSFGDDQHGQAGVSYRLFATAKLATLEDIGSSSPRSWFSFASLCSAFSSRTQTVNALARPITLSRYVPAPVSNESSKLSSSLSIFGPTLYRTTTRASQIRNNESTSIPLEVLDKIKVFARVPEHMAIGVDEQLPLGLRLCAEGLTEEESTRLRMSGFSVELEQVERYRSVCPPGYSNAFQLPTPSRQPPRSPLRDPHPLQAVYELSIAPQGFFDTEFTQQRSFSLLSPNSSGEFLFAGDTRIFAHPPQEVTAAGHDDQLLRSYSVEAPLALMHSDGRDYANEKTQRQQTARLGWTASNVIRPTTDSPHLGVRHRMHVSLHCLWDSPGAVEPIQERVEFTIPISFVHVQQEVPASEMSQVVGAVSKPAYPAGSLPPYSQLFHSNGERRLEYGLPAYEPVASI